MPIQIVKKDKSLQNFNPNKIVDAIRKSADRACVKLTQKQEKAVVDYVCKFLIEHGQEEIEVAKLHNIVENALDEVDPKVAKCYRDYRNYKTNFFSMIDQVYQKKLSLSFIADRSNANADSALVTTQKLDRLIAAAANTGLSCHPRRLIKTPAARGIPSTL